MIYLAVYAFVGVVVATLSIPWRDVSIHAKWSSLRLEQECPRSAWYVSALFWIIAAALWPISWRWKAIGAFDGDDKPPLQQVDDEEA